MQPEERAEYLAEAVATTEEVGPIALRYFRQPIVVEDKSGGRSFDPVTQADREIEAAIRTRLSARYPDHSILGEEQEESVGSSSRRWVIDPIDGTRAFMSGMPAWGILLGLCEEDRSVVGVLHQPFLGEIFAGDGHAATLRTATGEGPLRTRATSELEEAVLYCTHPSMFPEDPERRVFREVSERCRMTRFGGDCYAYALLAMGQVDLVIEGRLKPYDIIPLIPIIEGAGGVVTRWDGASAAGGGLVVAAANPTLHRKAVDALAGRTEAST